jgi:DNA-binding IclR family transcriptional regulator
MSVERPMGILQKASDVIELLADRGPLTPGDIAESIGMPRPSVYRLVEALNQSRLTVTTPDSRIKISERWLRLADASRSAMHEWEPARATLDLLCRETGQTTFLTVPRGDHAVCVDWAQGRGINVLILKPGRSLPLYAGAAGRATLAFRKHDVAPYLQRAPFPALTRRTLTTAPQLRRDIKLTRDRGYSVSDEDVTDGIAALGVPLSDRGGELRGALSLGGLAEDIRGNQADFAARLTAAGVSLTEALEQERR